MKLALVVIVSILAGAALGGLAGWYLLDAIQQINEWTRGWPWRA